VQIEGLPGPEITPEVCAHLSRGWPVRVGPTTSRLDTVNAKKPRPDRSGLLQLGVARLAPIGSLDRVAMSAEKRSDDDETDDGQAPGCSAHAPAPPGPELASGLPPRGCRSQTGTQRGQPIHRTQ
jgi:hypothetical protein